MSPACLIMIIVGADMKIRNSDDETFLHLSTEKRHESVVRLLLHLGIDVNNRGQVDSTPLMKAAFMGHYRMTKLLIKF